MKSKSNQDQRYVIIIGSGFHKQAYGETLSNNLTSWDCLLESIGYNSKNKTIGNYILDFELLITMKTQMQSDKKANEIENKLLRKIAHNITKEQKIAVSKKKEGYPLEIFNPRKVSDVISLNFDLVPEILLNNSKSLRVKYCHQNFTSKSEKETKRRIDNTRHRTINLINGETITFWHPHGDIAHANSLQLGIRKYGISIAQVELLRKRYKQNEAHTKTRKADYVESWFDKIMNQPVIIVGASMSHNEWDLWFALVNKMRNYAKKQHKHHSKPVYKMNFDSANIPNGVFTELAPISSLHQEQWQALIKMLT